MRTETTKLTATAGNALADLGLSVAIDGDTIVAGAPTDLMFGGDAKGSATVFFTATPPPPPPRHRRRHRHPPPPATAPVLSGLAITPSTFRAGPTPRVVHSRTRARDHDQVHPLGGRNRNPQLREVTARATRLRPVQAADRVEPRQAALHALLDRRHHHRPRTCRGERRPVLRNALAHEAPGTRRLPDDRDADRQRPPHGPAARREPHRRGSLRSARRRPQQPAPRLGRAARRRMHTRRARGREDLPKRQRERQRRWSRQRVDRRSTALRWTRSSAAQPAGRSSIDETQACPRMVQRTVRGAPESVPGDASRAA